MKPKADLLSSEVDFSCNVAGVQELVCLMTAGLAEILFVERLDCGVVLRLAEIHLCIDRIERLCTLCTQVNEVADGCG